VQLCVNTAAVGRFDVLDDLDAVAARQFGSATLRWSSGCRRRSIPSTLAVSLCAAAHVTSLCFGRRVR
jgi:hypothetical protein